jgi:two-component system NtrC family sensor kinase
MLKKLGRSITIVNVVAFVIIALVGGVSIYLTKDILRSAYKIEKMSRDIIKIDDIHSESYRLVLSIHHFLIDPDELYSEESLNAISTLKETVERYKADEMEESRGDENSEIKYLNIMLSDIQGLSIVKQYFEDFSRTGVFDRNKLIDLEEFAYELENTADKINKVHSDLIKESINESLVNMWIILFIYLVFVAIGGLTIYMGHFAIVKKVVNPIKRLAAATTEFADGKLERRVYTDSKTEVGQLYQSFNRMVAKLKENDEVLRKFNEELERKVKERTLELEQANEKLQKTQLALIRTEKIAAVGQIAAGVTHEIKNPLNSLSINAQMLMKELADKFGTESYPYESAALIKYEINRINNILEEFVKFAKLPEPQFFPNNINQVIREVIHLIVSGAHDLGVNIRLELQEDIGTFRFDARQFKEVIINLLQNAIKSMPKGGDLKVNTRALDENVIITVTDTGEGISEKNIEKIFTPFFSTKEGGLGLGLPIVQRIIESHGGKIICSSVMGEGTTFEIILPMME